MNWEKKVGEKVKERERKWGKGRDIGKGEGENRMRPLR